MTPSTAELDAALAYATARSGLRWHALVVHEAAPPDRAIDLISGVTFLLTAVGVYAALHAAQPAGESWDGLPAPLRLVSAAGLGLVAALGTAAVAGRRPALRRRLLASLTPRRRAARDAARHAAAHFAALNEASVNQAHPHEAAPAPRLLVHAVLQDLRVTVLVNPGAHDRLGPEGPAPLCRLLTDALRHHDPADPLPALAAGVRAAADTLIR